MTNGGVEDSGDSVKMRPLPSPAVIHKGWKIPFLPVSMNKLYSINFAKRCVYMTPEARDWKTKAKMCVSNFPVSKNDKLSFSMDVYTEYFYKNGNMKRSDIQNLIKISVDAVSERLGFDDSQIWSFSANKIQSSENYCLITLEKKYEK
jgi:Holliday junction resolvase RusA-like endonuclease